VCFPDLEVDLGGEAGEGERLRQDGGSEFAGHGGGDVAELCSVLPEGKIPGGFWRQFVPGCEGMATEALRD
jgi:hypothetical protein